jgi:hypothetical protein
VKYAYAETQDLGALGGLWRVDRWRRCYASSIGRPSGFAPYARNTFVQIAEAGVPYVAVVPVTVKGSHIEFTLPTGGKYSGEHFIGAVGASAIAIRWSRGTTEVLSRGKSYWQ